MEMLQPCEEQKFSIWVPKDQTKELYLIIVYGMPLAEAYCCEKNIWQTSEKIFCSFYLQHKEDFRIYGSKDVDETVIMQNNSILHHLVSY